MLKSNTQLKFHRIVRMIIFFYELSLLGGGKYKRGGGFGSRGRGGSHKYAPDMLNFTGE